MEVSDDQAPQHYPTNDGNGCECNNYDAAYCIASCASNIRNHEVRYQHGVGAVTVTCSGGNFVLGCSSMAHNYNPGTPVDKCRSWASKDDSACECYEYDEHGITCYAVCGQII